MAGSGSEACSDSPASSKEERKMAKRQVELLYGEIISPHLIHFL